MKTKYTLIGTAAVLLLSSWTVVQAKQSSLNASRIWQQLSEAPKPELPAKAAQMVLTEQGDDREKATELIVGTAIELSAVSTPMIVSSVCKLSPDMAPVVATTAAVKQPKEIRAIAKAAAAAAPSQALKIVSAMCKKQPSQYQAISVAVAEAVPKIDRGIISAVVEAVPTLKPFYLRAAESLAKDNDGNPIVARYMDQIARDISLSAHTLRTSEQMLVASGITPGQQGFLPQPPPVMPMLRPAFQPLPGTPGEINRDQTFVIPPTGTRYSSP
jgi:hypothetical protein